MKSHGRMGRILTAVMILAAGTAMAAPDIGFYCSYSNKDLDIGSPATGTLTNVTTVSGGLLLVPTNKPAGVTYGNARQYLNTSGAGWGTNTIAGIIKLSSVDVNRHVIYSSSGGADNGWGMFFYINNMSPAIQINSNNTPLINMTSISGVTMQSNVEYFVAASWSDQGTGSPMQATLYILNRYTRQSWFASQTGTINTCVPKSTNGDANDPLGQIRIGARQAGGNADPLNGSVDAIWGIRQFTASSNAYAQLVTDLGAEPPAVRVALDGSGADGLTWGTAYTNLQTAVDSTYAAFGVWVKQGVYSITNPILMRDYVSVYGGFAGTETVLTQRNWRVNTTTISNSVTATQADPNHRVFYCDGKASWRLDGLTIRNGQYWATNTFNESYNNMGAGIRAKSVTGNCAIDNCTIRDCKPANGALYAGGIAFSMNSPGTMSFQRDLFYNNQGSAGGGAWIDGTGAIDIKNCMFVSNYGISSGSGNGSGLNILGSNTKVINCVFYGNYWAGSDRGSALRVDGADALIANCVFMTNLNSTAIAAQNTSITNISVSNCCFYANATNGVAYDALTTNYYTDIAAFNAISRKGANIAGNPKFVNAAALDFTFPGSSPCVDAGCDAGGYAPSTDYYGNPRPVDRPGLGVDGSAAYDIGIYEIGLPRGTCLGIQ